MEFQFKETHTFEARKAESERIRNANPNRIPVIVEKLPNANVEDIDKRKFLVPDDITMSQLMYIIRKRIKLESDRSLFLYINQSIPSASATISEIYKANCDEDGFLYISYCGESTFGC